MRDEAAESAEHVGTDAADTADTADAADDAARRRRGSVAVYAVAFGLMVAATACLVIGALGILSIVKVAETSWFGTQRILRVASALAALSIVVAIASVLVPRRAR